MTEPHPRRPSQPGPKEERASFRAMMARRIAVGAAVVLAFVLLAGMAFTVGAIRSSQIDRARTIDQTALAARSAAKAAHAAVVGTKRIEDCTTPGRGCFQDGQKRTAQVVGGLNGFQVRSAAAGATCALHESVKDYPHIYACILRTLAAQEKP